MRSCMTPPTFTSLPMGAAVLPSMWADLATNAAQAGARAARAPFDAARVQYAGAVRAGWFRRSILASRDFERALDTLEHITLGPWARNV